MQQVISGKLASLLGWVKTTAQPDDPKTVVVYVHFYTTRENAYAVGPTIAGVGLTWWWDL